MNKYNEQGERHGPWETYFSKDSLQLRIVYENGKQNGLFEQYFDNGQIQHIGHQKDGKLFGIWRHYNRDGKLHTVRKMRKCVEVELYVDYEENLVKFILS
jgi:antitoxin component YwqK of YwqJK toxin-antitoxin module